MSMNFKYHPNLFFSFLLIETISTIIYLPKSFAKKLPFNHCSITTDNINFGKIIPYKQLPYTITAKLKITCTCHNEPNSKNNYKIRYDISFLTMNSSVSVKRILKKNNLSAIEYNIYADGAFNRILGGYDSENTLKGSFDMNAGETKTYYLTIYGKIPAGQNHAEIGEYIDKIHILMKYEIE